EMYDLINSRFLGEGINSERWPAYLRELISMLKPGGWLQIMEYYFNIQSDTGRMAEAPALQQWIRCYLQSMRALNRNPGIGRELQQLLRSDRRVVNMQAPAQLNLPIGEWHTGTIS
ncbi:hypothetical protein LTR28_013266, partial [Elasticomyces elasticus]